MISSIVLFFRRDWAGGAGPAVDWPRAAGPAAAAGAADVVEAAVVWGAELAEVAGCAEVVVAA